MPALFIDSCSQIKNILEKMDTSVPHNWLISYLECYDTTGWAGCEKWGERSLLLTDEDLKRDVYLRDMQFIWGVFSAIPAAYSRQEIEKYALPDLEKPDYMANRIIPQHPLAFLEISVWDGSYTYICAHDEALLKAFAHISDRVMDAEEDNKTMNRELRRIQDKLRHMAPNVSDAVANEVQWVCWHALFHGTQKGAPASDQTMESLIKAAYQKASAEGYRFRYTFWDPYDQT